MSSASDIPEHVRLFIAVPVPPAIRETIENVQWELKRLLPDAAIRWTASEQVHLTLLFFGSVSSEQVDEVKQISEATCTGIEAFRVQASGLGVFPNKRRPRVIWVGVQDEKGELAALQREIQSATAQFGEKPEGRPFSAHLTLGRIKELRPREAAVLRRFLEGEKQLAGEWHVGHVELFRSELALAEQSILSSPVFLSPSKAAEFSAADDSQGPWFYFGC